MEDFKQNNTNINNFQYGSADSNYQAGANPQELQYQILQQQQMINQMMQQQQQLIQVNQQLKSQNQNPGIANSSVGYSGTATTQTLPLNIKIRNLWSLIAAVLLFVAMVNSDFAHCVDRGDWSKNISLSDLCSQLSMKASGWRNSGFKLLVLFAGWMFYITVATFIISVLGGFIDVTTFKRVLNFISVLCIIDLTFVIKNVTSVGDETSFVTGYYVLIAGVVVTIIGIFKDNKLKYMVPEDNNLESGEWRCPKCDTKNTRSSCKVCGTSRK